MKKDTPWDRLCTFAGMNWDDEQERIVHKIKTESTNGETKMSDLFTTGDVAALIGAVVVVGKLSAALEAAGKHESMAKIDDIATEIQSLAGMVAMLKGWDPDGTA